MLWFVGQVFRDGWKTLFLADVVFKLVAFVVLTPLVGVVFRAFLWLAGRSVLADTDIAAFLIHPIGLVAFVVVGGAVVAILALEQAAFISIALCEHAGRPLKLVAALRFVAERGPSIFYLTARMVTLALLAAAPFLAVGGGLYLLLLTEHDINFYLAKRPPVFFVAVGTIGLTLAVGGIVLLRMIVGWSMALPILLFEDIPPSGCLATSAVRTRGHRRTIAAWIVAWAVATSLLSAGVTGGVVELGHLIVPQATSSIVLVALTVGLVLLTWFAANFLLTLVTNTLFGTILAALYHVLGRTDATRLPEPGGDRLDWAPRLTRGRLAAALVVGVLIATLIGATAIHGISLEDRVQITAHRGASGRAPENTMAAVRLAIDDGADWLEIDVQESKDGVIVVVHDSDLKKVAGVATRIWEATADELRSVDVGSFFDSKFEDERVPTLAEVLEACRGKIKVNIELKVYGHGQQLEQRVADLVEQYKMTDDIVVMSLDPQSVRTMRQLRPDWTVGLLTAVAIGDLTRADADFLAVSTRLATRRFVHAAHRRDKQVYVWTVNDPLTMSAMIGRGADNIITDHPAMARAVLAERAAMSPLERLLVELAFYFGATPPNSSDDERP